MQLWMIAVASVLVVLVVLHFSLKKLVERVIAGRVDREVRLIIKSWLDEAVD